MNSLDMTSKMVHVVKLLLLAFRMATPDRLTTSLGCLPAAQMLVVKVVIQYRRTVILELPRLDRHLLVTNAVWALRCFHKQWEGIRPEI
ncbi:hypothetical protein CRV24_008663 [Beauveria bassiana]|nr:hypothetical protein CRV24_008663 [Beauveria bassiana]KAH8715388.1 hypothetical protein HC256_004214 [Beauveria bassiana]